MGGAVLSIKISPHWFCVVINHLLGLTEAYAKFTIVMHMSVFIYKKLTVFEHISFTLIQS